jgi:hypothetical protein
VNRGSGQELAAQDVHYDEHNDHQDGDPDRHLTNWADASSAPVQGESPAAGEAKVTVFASSRLEWADTATFRAGLRIQPLRHEPEIARAGKNFQ